MQKTIQVSKKEAKIRLLGKVFRYTVDFFHRKGFTQLMPVMLGKSVDPLGPDPGSSIVGIPEIAYQGEVFRLVTSMILHKQVAVRELEKIFIMSPNVRLERSERQATGKHLFEFTQADFEIAHAKTDDVLSLLEEYYKGLSEYLKGEPEFDELGLKPFEFKPPFARYTTKEMSEKYGDDWETPASVDHDQPFWVLSHKREFYDKEHPDREGEYLNYDIIYPMGYGEGISGAEREHDHDKLKFLIDRDGLDKKAYEQYLSKAKEGFVPSAGAGIGMERLARFLTRSHHVADVSMFRRVPGEKVDI